MSAHRRASFVALPTLLHRRFPGVDDPARLVRAGLVLVDGAPATNPRAQVRADASLRLLRTQPLRGTRKLAPALAGLGVRVSGRIALDLGAAAGGFTQALLDGGAARVYAVDAGSGQLCDRLCADPRVINLEGTNLALLDRHLVPEPVDLVTMDLTYLAVARAVGQIDHRLMAPGAQLVALVKPTFELRAGTLAAQPQQVAAAAAAAAEGLARHGWSVLGRHPSPIRGSHGAVEIFLHARRRGC